MKVQLVVSSSYLTFHVLGSNSCCHTVFYQISTPDGLEVTGPHGRGAGWGRGGGRTPGVGLTTMLKGQN
jgi:hypothetical protein